MQRYVNFIASTTSTSSTLMVLSNATCTVYVAGTSTAATLYSDNGITPLANPFLSSSTGQVAFYAANGLYDLVVSKIGYLTVTISAIELDDLLAPSGSNSVGYLPAGTGAVATTVQTKLRESVSVKDFGAVGDGVTDDTAAIQAAINATQTAGGGIIFVPLGAYKISSTLTITGNGVVLQGAAFNSIHDTGSPTYPVRFNWAGGASPMISIVTTSATLPVTSGCGLINLALFGNSLATVGVYLNSVRYSFFTNLYVNNVLQDCYYITCLTKTTGEATDTQQNIFTNCTWRTIDSPACYPANGMTLTAAIPGGSNANTSFNEFNYCAGQNYSDTGGGVGFVLADADNNLFVGCRAFRAGATPTVIYGLSIRGGDTNIFNDFSCGGANGIEIRGIASGYFADQVGNCFWNTDDSNGTQYPALDTGCRIQWHALKSGYRNTWVTQSVIADNATYTVAAIDDIGTSSLRVVNNSSNHIRLSDPTNTNQWGINVDATTGNLRVVRVSGTGSFGVSGATYAAYGGATGFGSPTGGAIIANFPGATATLAQTSQTVAEILVVLKGLGFIAA